MNEIKCAFIVCWFGNLPKFFDKWIQSVSDNEEFDFIIITDQVIKRNLPHNIIVKKYTLKEFSINAKNQIGIDATLNKPYRVCDFRPMYGVIFRNFLVDYTFWGYCDIDLIFGKLSDFISIDDLKTIDAYFNCGSLTLIRNCPKMNFLYKEKGALFNYKTVISHNAIFAFDEFTGIQRIAKENNINAKYLIPYIDADSKYSQLISRFDKINPEIQGFYWENGKLYRVRVYQNKIQYQNIAYIHLQKRKLIDNTKNKGSFWITPWGFEDKKINGIPTKKDIEKFNPPIDSKTKSLEKIKYYKNKILEILARSPFQIYVRIKQQFNGINSNDNSLDERKWIS